MSKLKKQTMNQSNINIQYLPQIYWNHFSSFKFKSFSYRDRCVLWVKLNLFRSFYNTLQYAIPHVGKTPVLLEYFQYWIRQIGK